MAEADSTNQPSTTRQCLSCRSVKSLGEFAPCRRRWRTHRQQTCRKCRRAEANRARNAGQPDPETVERQCTACGETKSGTEYNKQPGGRFGLKSECKNCLKARRLAYMATPRAKAVSETWQRLDKLRGYGLSPAEYQSMSDVQRGVCAICGRPETARTNAGAVRDLCVDHDHTTGKVRGLLCAICNASLGGFRDDQTILLSAVAYLRRHSEVNTSRSNLR